MKAQFKHLATMTENGQRMAKFYEAAFGMKGYKPDSTPADTTVNVKSKPRAYTLSDGNVGFNFNSRKPGRPAALDHFGIEVEDTEATCNRIRDKYPKIKILKRPSTRPKPSEGHY